ncbi:NADAR family protein [Streptomyces sp. 796.1]|uniref:NADAR family protein n=1 Tax=Streptomyces sp. 796.1 TaxID=3163029 RepID=UPI0039C93605
MGAAESASGTVPARDGGPRSVAEVIERLARGERLKYVHFWGHEPRRDGALSAACFSQWWPAPFTVEQVTYATAEHWMMAGKARLFDDTETERRIIAAPHPGQAKELGRSVRGFDEKVWLEHRFELVVRGSVEKFRQHPALHEYLLNSGNRILVEASPVDRIWGIGLSADDDRTANPTKWRGLNLLGFALMEARHRLA